MKAAFEKTSVIAQSNLIRFELAQYKVRRMFHADGR